MTVTTPEGDVVPTLSHRQVMVVFGGLMVGMLLSALDQLIVASALPTITGDLGGLNHLSWVVTAYLLASAVSIPLGGKLGDLYGRKLLFQISILVFIGGSALCGAAQSMGHLIVARGIQGLGGGGLTVLAQAIVGEIVTPRERGRYQGYFGAVLVASSVAGPLAGGLFTDHLSWRWAFYVNVPMGILAFLAASAALPAGLRRGNPHVDYAGAVLLTAATSSIVLFTTWGGAEHPWGSPIIVGLIATSLVAAVAFVLVERRAREPVVPMRLFATPTFSIAAATTFILGVGMYAAFSFLPLFLQLVHDVSATRSGVLMMPLMFGTFFGSLIAGQLTSRTGRYKIFPVVGTALATGSMALLATMSSSTPLALTTIYAAGLGLGVGGCSQTLLVAAQNVVPMKDLGVGTSSVNFFRTIGGSIGVATFGAIFNNQFRDRIDGVDLDVAAATELTRESLRGLPPQEAQRVVDAYSGGVTAGFVFLVPLMVVAVVAIWFMREVPLRSSHQHAADVELSAVI